MNTTKTNAVPQNFIRHIIDADLAHGKNGNRVATRFPPEPNGYLHIGHAKSICLNFGLALDYNGTCNLRFDDTNPTKEDVEYVDSIIDTVRWLGFDWQNRLYYASDYFEKLFNCAVELIKCGKAYVCDLSPDEMRTYRGTLTEAGTDSPYRNREIAENLALFMRMRQGEFADGAKVLRAKINMAAPNLNMRDPIIYRIRKAQHHRTKDAWCIYPMYDFAHCFSDSFENITHSICTLEFADHRELYDWFLDALKTQSHPQQIEFSRLNLNYTVMSKRKLLELVHGNYVHGWDDPRLPTLVGLRRRGVTPQAIRNFCERIGVSRQDSVVDMTIFDECVREDLNKIAPRALAVLKPLKLIIDNFPEGVSEELEAAWHPQDSNYGTRKISFTREIYIERDDFCANPPKDFFRLTPGHEVRLRYAYIIKCEKVISDPISGEPIAIHCRYDKDTKSGAAASTKKVKGTIHWVSATESTACEVRLYDRLFTVANPERQNGADYKDFINPDSLKILTAARIESSVARILNPNAAPIETKFINSPPKSLPYQFERLGYFCLDQDSRAEKLIFNRVVTLKDTWGKSIIR